MRIRGRIGAAPQIPYEAKYPILLPKDHPVTLLLIDRYHRRYLHSNRETVVNEVRQRFWIPKLRAVVPRVSKDCQFCRIHKASAQPPVMGPLPKVRLTPFIRPFTYTGLDYFGPILVKVGRSLVKRWIALFTCLTIRAVHLEVVHSLNTSSCIKAIRRFVVRRGAPDEIYSDNGTCFVGANRQLMEQLREINGGCASVFTNARTKWLFNPPAAPHMGGVWERMVRSVKVAMAAVAGAPRHPDDETLETVILEAEGIVNTRPLTYVPLDVATDEALTPNHFLLYGNRGVTQPSTEFVAPCQTLRDSWKLTQHLADEFWRRWVREYLPVLRRQVKWFEPTKPLEVNDLVIVIEESARNHWERGVITEIYPGSDGHVRSAMIQTSTGIKKRPVTKLALLDVRKAQSKEDDRGSQQHGAGYVEKAPRLGNGEV
ncbi:uncharacterized protein LOC135712074 [Ochlerotatus camptorhynchus]|uniref:uncharacterized protein LOC135712074 n=1 Tax=Ochlerotatus camptorhynchus TaxID=644619 RepID=UPI0031E210A7